MELLLVVNPAASSVSPRVQVLVQSVFSQHHSVELVETTRRNHATRLAEDAARRRVDSVIVLGGDGTVNEVANGLIGSDTALAPLPGGSTNVFCRTLKLPDDPQEAARRSLQAMNSGLIERVGLGRANGRYFMFHTGVGFDAAVVEQVERQSDLKRYLNHPLFVYAAIKTWLRHYDRKRPAFDIDFEDSKLSGGFFLICQNTDPYTYLGSQGLSLSPATNLDTGLAAVTLMSLRADGLLRLAADALRPPRGLRANGIVDLRENLTGFVVRARRPVPVQVDGDFVGNSQRVVFEYEPSALALVRSDRLPA